MRQVMKATAVLVFGAVLGLAAPAVATHIFPDVADDDAHADGIHWAFEQNLVEGYDDGRFGPNDGLTRGQLATILERQRAHRGPVYSLTPDCGSLTMVANDHNNRGSGAATVEYSIDGGDRVTLVGEILPLEPFEFEVDGPGVVTLYVDSIAWASTPTGQDCTPPAAE